jgi:hypothetical protein
MWDCSRHNSPQLILVTNKMEDLYQALPSLGSFSLKKPYSFLLRTELATRFFALCASLLCGSLQDATRFLYDTASKIG